MAFRVGQKVACVRLTPWEGMNEGEVAPQYQQILTIRTIHSDVSDGSSPYYFSFNEIRNPKLYDRRCGEAIFGSRNFRPVQERKRETDISVFLKLLTPERVG